MKKLLIISLSISTILLSFTNCKDNSKNYQSDTESQITYVQGNDQEMNDAIEKAKANIGKFEKALADNSKSDKYDGFIIKQGFKTDNGGTEHMWIMNITSKNNKLEGVLGNTPSQIANLKLGDKVIIDKNLISDWTYTDKETGAIYGAYTMQVLRKHMNAEEGAQFDKEWGTNFADK